MAKKYPYRNIHEDKNTYKHKNILKQEDLELLIYFFAFAIIPLIPLHQLITGAIVNALLIKSAIDYKSKKVFILSVIPSTAVVLGGVLFGNLSSQMIIMLPIIWVGNLVLMILVRKYYLREKKNFFTAITISATIKVAILFGAAILFFTQSWVPVLFLTMFGIIQFITAISGGIIVFFSKKLFEKD